MPAVAQLAGQRTFIMIVAAGENSATKLEVELPLTLADMGLTHKQSSRYQQLAAMPDEHFETAVATAKDTAGEVTTAFMCSFPVSSAISALDMVTAVLLMVAIWFGKTVMCHRVFPLGI